MHKTTAFQNQGILHRLRQRKRHRQRAMKLRELQSCLEGVTDFQEPKAELEQYVTPPHLAAQIVHIMGCDFDDVEGKRLCDLGCGTGMLTIAVAVAGAQHVTGMDIDADAIEIAQQSAVDYDCENIVDFVRADLSANVVHSQKLFDTVVMNPPFGTKRKGVDILFLCTALNLARSSVYSMHKTSTRSFIEKKFRKFGVDGKVLAKMRFNIGRTYAFQKKNAVDVEVDLWHFDVQNASVIPASDTLINVDRPLEFIGTNGTGVYNVQDRKMQKKRRGKQR